MKPKILLFVALVCLAVLPSMVWAQDIVVKGIVKDPSGNPVPGASVTIKGTDHGAVSGTNGAFTVHVSSQATLVFSAVGFATKEVAVNGQAEVEVTLAITDTKLTDVVVVGYGSQKRKDITSSIATIDTKDIGSRPAISTAEALQGKAAGVQVIQPSGAPGSDFSIHIRGIGSPNGTEPLYVVDGVMVDNTDAIDPNNIESISVLKDAAATGVYGSAQANNGVVLITTKSGKKGKTSTEGLVYTGFQQITKKLDMLNTTQYKALLNDEYTNAGQTPPNIPANYNANNNWQDLVYHTAPQTGANLNFSGGTEKGTWNLNLGYLNQDGIIHTSNFVRYQANFKIEQDMNNWLSVGAHINYNRANTTSVPDGASAQHGGTVLAALTTPPMVPVMDTATGIYSPNIDGTANPIGNIYDNINNKVLNNMVGDAHIEIKLPFHLKYRSQFGVSLNNFNYNYFLNPTDNDYGISLGGAGNNETQEIFHYTWDNMLTFNHYWGDNALTITGVTEVQDEKYWDNQQSGNGFATATIPTLNAASTNKSVYSYQTDWGIMSYIGRITYAYQDKYLFGATVRADGSSRVGFLNKWGYFPAGSFGWRISKEDFLKDAKWLTDLKLRVGYGATGNLPPANLTTYPSYSALNPGALYLFGPDVAAGVSPSNPIGNAKLKWESGKQLDLGFDLTLFNNRLSVTGDYYNKQTDNLIFEQILPATTGNSDGETFVNLPGKVSNKGFELSVSGTIVKTRDFSWSGTFNISHNKNNVTGLDSGTSYATGGIGFGGSGTNQYPSIIKNGLPLGAFWGYVAQGVNPQTGNMIFKDVDHDGAITPNDRTYLGSGAPTWIYSYINNFSYKNWGLDLLFDAVSGNKIFDATRIETEGMVGPGNASTEVLHRWEKPGDITNVPIAIAGDPGTGNNGTPNSSISSRFIEDGAFLRVKAATLSYNFNSAGLKHIGVYGIRCYLTAQNLFTITGYKGYNPEVNQQGTSAQALGIDYGTYPQAKTYILGVNVNL